MKKKPVQTVEPRIINYDAERTNNIAGHMSDYDGYSDEARQLPAPRRQTFVPAAPKQRIIKMPDTVAAYSIEAPLSAIQSVEMRTSSVDRAKGYLLRMIPLFATVALLAVLTAVYFADWPFLSLASFLLYWTVFAICWLISYIHDMSISPEGVSYFEARSKWGVIREEQRQRWNHYNRLVDGGDE